MEQLFFLYFKKSYGKKGLLLNAFDYFKNTSYLLFLEWLFYLTIPCVVLIGLISNSVEFYDKRNRNKQNGKNM